MQLRNIQILFRFIRVRKVKPCEVETSPELYIRKYKESSEKIWGISLGDLEHTEHLEIQFKVYNPENLIPEPSDEQNE